MDVSIALKYFATISQINLAFRAYKPMTEIENSFLRRVKTALMERKRNPHSVDSF